MRLRPVLTGLLGPTAILLVTAVATSVASALSEEVHFQGQLEPGIPANGRRHVIRKEVDSLGFVHELLVPTSLSEVREASLGERYSPSPGTGLDPYNVPAPFIGPPGPRGPLGSKGIPGKRGAVGSKGKKGQSGVSSDTEVAKALEDHEPMASMFYLVGLVVANFALVGACHFFVSSHLIKPTSHEGADAGAAEDVEEFDDDADPEGETDVDGEGPREYDVAEDEHGGAEEHETEGSPQT